jgi:hypothetical protein
MLSESFTLVAAGVLPPQAAKVIATIAMKVNTNFFIFSFFFN